jgi:hypothetical protein
MRLRILLSVLGFLLIAQFVQAKGPANKIVITGPDFNGEFVLTDQEMLNHISMAGLEDFQRGILSETPSVEGEGYEMTRYFESDPGKYRPFDVVIYYPSPENGVGYVFYDGIIDGWSEYDDQWFYATPEGYETMERVLQAARLKSYLIQVMVSLRQEWLIYTSLNF